MSEDKLASIRCDLRAIGIEIEQLHKRIEQMMGMYTKEWYEVEDHTEGTTRASSK